MMEPHHIHDLSTLSGLQPDVELPEVLKSGLTVGQLVHNCIPASTHEVDMWRLNNGLHMNLGPCPLMHFLGGPVEGRVIEYFYSHEQMAMVENC